MDPVVHFEFSYDDRKRIQKFYQKAFDWETIELDDKGRYVLASSAKGDEHNWSKEAGKINGGFYPRNKDSQMQYPLVIISVKDLNASMKKVVAAGGKVLGKPMDIKGFGLYISVFDTEGNRVSMMQMYPVKSVVKKSVKKK